MSETDINEEAMAEAEITMGETSSEGGSRRNHLQLVTIFHVPHHMRSGRESNYEPGFVSIGPYFHGRQNLSDMENRKAQIALDLDQYISTGQSNIIDTLITRFSSSEVQARACYNDSFDLNSHDFLKMLALDSCFIIMVIISAFNRVWESVNLLGFDIKEIRSDLLLLENQIPFFIVDDVYDVVRTRVTSTNPLPYSLRRVLVPFLCLDMPMILDEDCFQSNIRNAQGLEHSHLFSYYWSCCLETFTPLIFSSDYSFHRVKAITTRGEFLLSANTDKLIPNATLLYRKADVTFQAERYPHHDCVRFQNRTVIMPCLKIDPNRTKLLLNFIAFEYFQAARSQIFMSFMLLMDALIDTEEDVALLQEQGVIRNNLHSNEQAATFFNDIGNLCSGASRSNFFDSMCNEVRKFYESSSNRQLATLRHNYCGNPWAVISLVAGSALLLMTFLQTFYTVYGYYNPH